MPTIYCSSSISVSSVRVRGAHRVEPLFLLAWLVASPRSRFNWGEVCRLNAVTNDVLVHVQCFAQTIEKNTRNCLLGCYVHVEWLDWRQIEVTGFYDEITLYITWDLKMQCQYTSVYDQDTIHYLLKNWSVKPFLQHTRRQTRVCVWFL